MDKAANMTAFARREKALGLVEVCPVPDAFVGKLAEQFTPPAVCYPLGKMVVRQHSLHIQIFGIDDLVLINQPPTEFVQEILTGIVHFFVLTSNHPPRLLPIV